MWKAVQMKSRKRKVLLSYLLLGTGAYVLYSLRDRQAIGDLRDRARNRYETASRRARGASDALRGQNRHPPTTASALLVGTGLGIGIRILLAPASGKETRADLSEKVRDLRDKVRERSSREPQGATGT
jgi:hypothetical protein